MRCFKMINYQHLLKQLIYIIFINHHKSWFEIHHLVCSWITVISGKLRCPFVYSTTMNQRDSKDHASYLVSALMNCHNQWWIIIIVCGDERPLSIIISVEVPSPCLGLVTPPPLAWHLTACGWGVPWPRHVSYIINTSLHQYIIASLHRANTKLHLAEK